MVKVPKTASPPQPPNPPNDGGPQWDESFGWRDDAGLAAAMIPNMMAKAFKASLTITVVLYVLNQKHMLPRPLSAIVSKALFWPTLPITVSKRIGKWITPIDDTVVLGGAPFGFSGIPERLYQDYNVRGVVNLCEEYKGPVQKYKKLGIRQLYLPTTDHFEPDLGDLEKAVDFIAQYKREGKRVYVHCRAGHGRSAAIVFAWLLSEQYAADGDNIDLKALNERMSALRNVRSGLWRQPNINMFHRKLRGEQHFAKGGEPNTNEGNHDKEL